MEKEPQFYGDVRIKYVHVFENWDRELEGHPARASPKESPDETATTPPAPIPIDKIND